MIQPHYYGYLPPSISGCWTARWGSRPAHKVSAQYHCRRVALCRHSCDHALFSVTALAMPSIQLSTLVAWEATRSTNATIQVIKSACGLLLWSQATVLTEVNLQSIVATGAECQNRPGFQVAICTYILAYAPSGSCCCAWQFGNFPALCCLSERQNHSASLC